MGGGKDRKSNDKFRVNVPQNPTTNGTGIGGGVIDMNEMCPMAFDVQLKPKRPLPNGMSVTVQGSDLIAMGEVVGQLSPARQKTILECGECEIRYSGRIINKDVKAYARFEQITPS